MYLEHKNELILPEYKSVATPEQKQQKLEAMAKQMRLLLEQEKDMVPLMKVKIRCGCLTLLPWWKMVKCLYCNLFYCPKCAEEHFGMRRENRHHRPEDEEES